MNMGYVKEYEGGANFGLLCWAAGAADQNQAVRHQPSSIYCSICRGNRAELAFDNIRTIQPGISPLPLTGRFGRTLRAVADDVSIRILIGEGSRMSSQLIAAELRRSRSPHFEVFLPPSFNSKAVVDEVVKILPDVALISNSLQDGSCAGYSALRALQSANVATRPVLLLEECEHDLVIDAFRAGARGVFSRTESSELLSKCICSVHKGQIWASTRDLEYILKELVARHPLRVVDARGGNLLSKREEEVVALVVDGLTNHQISEQLRLSENTVKNYLFRVFEKLGVSTRVELVLYALYQNRGNGTGAQSQSL